MSIFAALMISLSFTACAVHTPEGSIIVDPDRSYYPHGQGDFCPPGQAKKGPFYSEGFFITYIFT